MSAPANRLRVRRCSCSICREDGRPWSVVAPPYALGWFATFAEAIAYADRVARS